jgi:hypothetical protein
LSPKPPIFPESKEDHKKAGYRTYRKNPTLPSQKNTDGRTIVIISVYVIVLNSMVTNLQNFNNFKFGIMYRRSSNALGYCFEN